MPDVAMQMKALVFDMLSCLSWLRSQDRLPAGDFERLETEARALLQIEEVNIAPAKNVFLATDEPELPLRMPGVEVLNGDLSTKCGCPKCGDLSPKIVHLKRRPRGGLQCQACRHEYAFQAVWI